MKVCEYYYYSHCEKHSGFVGGTAHLSMGCPYENKDGFPVAWKQRLFCKDYKKKEDKL